MFIGYILILIVVISPILYHQNKRIRSLEEKLGKLDEQNKQN